MKLSDKLAQLEELEAQRAPELQSAPVDLPYISVELPVDPWSARIEVSPTGHVEDLATHKIIGIDIGTAMEARQPIDYTKMDPDMRRNLASELSQFEPGEEYYDYAQEQLGKIAAETLRLEAEAERARLRQRPPQPPQDQIRRIHRVPSTLGITPRSHPEAESRVRKGLKLAGNMAVKAVIQLGHSPNGGKSYHNHDNPQGTAVAPARQHVALPRNRTELKDRAPVKAIKAVFNAGINATASVVGGMLDRAVDGMDEKADIDRGRSTRRRAQQDYAKAKAEVKDLEGVSKMANLSEADRAENERKLAIARGSLGIAWHYRQRVSARPNTYRHQPRMIAGPGNHKAQGPKTRKASKYDAVFEAEAGMFPSEEARLAFKNLHDKRIRTLKLGIETGYKFRKGKIAYKRAYADYQAALGECWASIVDHESSQAGHQLNPKELGPLAQEMIANEIHAMTVWQYELAMAAQSTRRARMMLWYQRQGFLAKGAIGLSLGLATGLAGPMVGAAAGMALVTGGKVLRATGAVKAKALGGQNIRQITPEEKAEYLSGGQRLYGVFDKIAEGQMDHVKSVVRKKRLGVAIVGLSLAGGYVAGQWLGDHLHHHGTGGTKHDTASGSRAQGSSATTTPGHTTTPQGPGERTLPTAVDRPRLAPDDSLLRPTPGGGGTVAGGAAEHVAGAVDGSGELVPLVSQITPGQGLIENLTHVGLSSTQAAHAVAEMHTQGLLDGSHIAGVAERAGNVVVYLRGAGDGALHFDNPEVLRIIAEAKNS